MIYGLAIFWTLLHLFLLNYPGGAVFSESLEMGGDHGHGFDTKSVWSPAGGWYPDPKAWRRNTGLAFAAIAVLSYGVFNVSRKLEARDLERPFFCPVYITPLLRLA